MADKLDKKVLIVEDEETLSFAIKQKLESEGLDTYAVNTVDKAMVALENKGSFDAIWVDHFLLGKENGLEFIAKIKNNEQWKTLPVFVVSNTAGHEAVQSYLELGVSKYYTKANHKLEDIVAELKAHVK